MISESKVMGFIPTKDAAKARIFYSEILGLPVVKDDPFALVLKSGDTIIRIAKLNELAPAPYTILGWRVTDIAHEVQTLAARGVTFTRYPGLSQDEQGIWAAPSGDKVAWFTDPDGNVLSLSQHVDES